MSLSPSSSELSKPFHFNLGPASALTLMAVVVGLMGLLSLTHLNAMSTQGYKIEELEDNYQDLVEDSEINSMLILRARSLENIQKSEVVATMVQPQQVYFLDGVTGLAQVEKN